MLGTREKRYTCDQFLRFCFQGDKTCSQIKLCNLPSGSYVIDPDGKGGVKPFKVYMTDKGGVGVTVFSHDSEGRKLVRGFLPKGSYSRSIKYTEADMAQLANLAADYNDNDNH